MHAVSAPMVVIVGTPRSGTTLVQRLVSEQCGVVVPPETHVLGAFARAEVHPRDFPLRGDALRQALDRYAASGWVDVDPRDLYDALGGECDSLRDLFAAVVGAATGWADRRGEKTPAHVRWLPYLRSALPETVVVVVVRDPRAVVASVLERRWSSGSAASEALRWRFDQTGAVVGARRETRQHLIVVRYEDVVADAEVALRPVLEAVGGLPAGDIASAPLRRDIEEWKKRAEEPVDASRTIAWQDTLRGEQRALVELLAGRRARALGYDVPPASFKALVHLRARDVRAIVRLVGYTMRTRAIVARYERDARRRQNA